MSIVYKLCTKACISQMYVYCLLSMSTCKAYLKVRVYTLRFVRSISDLEACQVRYVLQKYAENEHFR